MKNIKVGSIISRKDGNRFGVTNIINDKIFMAIWVGNKSFTDKTTFNAFMRHSDFRTDRSIFLKTKKGFRKLVSAPGVIGLGNLDSNSLDLILS